MMSESETALCAKPKLLVVNELLNTDDPGQRKKVLARFKDSNEGMEMALRYWRTGIEHRQMGTYPFRLALLRQVGPRAEVLQLFERLPGT